MCVLAWLMLVVTSLTAAPLDAAQHPIHAAHTKAALASEHCNHCTSAKANHSCCGEHAGCCGSFVGHACGCAVIGAGLLPPALTSIADAMLVAMSYGTLQPSGTLSSDTVPPLRPPAA
jgi:hypothetical protein